MNKIETITQIYEETTKEIGKNKKWTELLDFISKFYKYNFQNTVLVYGQRKDATAVAQYDIWRKLGRTVKRNSKGIMLLDNDSVKYGFDVSDTAVIKKDLVYIWEYSNANVQPLIDNLKKEINLSDQENDFEKILGKYVENICTKRIEGIKFKSQEGLIATKNLLIQSTTYVIEERLNLKHKEVFDFKDVYKSYNYLISLGKLTNQASSEILRNIERTIKNIEFENIVCITKY